MSDNDQIYHKFKGLIRDGNSKPTFKQVGSVATTYFLTFDDLYNYDYLILTTGMSSIVLDNIHSAFINATSLSGLPKKGHTFYIRMVPEDPTTKVWVDMTTLEPEARRSAGDFGSVTGVGATFMIRFNGTYGIDPTNQQAYYFEAFVFS